MPLRKPGEWLPRAVSRHSAHSLQAACPMGTLSCVHHTAGITRVPPRRRPLKAPEMPAQVLVDLGEPQLSSSSQSKVDQIQIQLEDSKEVLNCCPLF